jgi:hypothetical protein
MSGLVARASAAWDRVWFAPASPVNLAAARIVICVHALWIVASRNLPATSSLPQPFWMGVPQAERWRFLLFPGHESLERVIVGVAILALAAGALGIRARAACAVAALLLYHLAPLETIYWTPFPYERGLTVDVLVLVVLAASRSADALALGAARLAAPSAEYGWPLRFAQLLFCQVYFLAGVAKLRRAGILWVSGTNLRRWLLTFSQEDQILLSRPISNWVANHAGLCWAIGVSALVLDLVLFTIVFSPRLRRALMPAALGFHAGIAVTMGIAFLNVPQFLMFVDWAGLAGRRTRVSAAHRTDAAPGSAVPRGA